MASRPALLEISGIRSGYGRGTVLFDLSLSLAEGEVVAVLGRNGMGKTTLSRTIMGLIRPMSGSITFAGRSLAGLEPYRIARAGIGLVPEGRLVCSNLTVRENLLASARSGPWTLERIYELFPRLKERASNPGLALSGGEQQMLAISRALLTNPRLLILDEATEGLAPVVRQQIWAVLEALKREGLTILIVDRNIKALRTFADRFAVIGKGQVVWEGDGPAFDRSLSELTGHLTV